MEHKSLGNKLKELKTLVKIACGAVEDMVRCLRGGNINRKYEHRTCNRNCINALLHVVVDDGSFIINNFI